MDSIGYIALVCLAFLAVAYGHEHHTKESKECDCDSFTDCIIAKKKACHENKENCYNTCKGELDPKVAAAMDKCRSNKNFDKCKCVMEKTCIARETPTTSEEKGKSKWRKHQKLARIAAILPEALGKTIENFRECVEKCKEEKRAKKDKKERCCKKYPTCTLEYKAFPEAKEECGVTRAEDCCLCLIDELGITEDSVCTPPNPDRVARSVGFEDEDDSAEDIL